MLKIAVGQLRLLILVGGHPLQPAERRDHRQQQMQFRVLGHFGLDEQRGDAGIQARGQPVDGHGPDVLLELRGVLIAGGQRVPIGNEEIAFVLVLQLDPILQRAVKIAQVQLAGRPHAGEHAAILNGPAHAEAPSTASDDLTDGAQRRVEQPSEQAEADKPSTMNKPTGSIFSRRAPTAGGSNPASTRPPSSGGIGSRLNTARPHWSRCPPAP